MDAIREIMYQKVGIEALFNPKRSPKEEEYSPGYQIVDLTKDVLNYTRVYHRNTDAIRGYVAQSDFVITDSVAMAAIVRRLMDVHVVILPFGHSSATDFDNEEGIRVGILNHDTPTIMNNQGAIELLESLEEHLLVYGEEIEDVENTEVLQDFDQFCARVDILLLPSLPNEVNGLTAPLSVMQAGSIVIANGIGGYYQLEPAPGIKIVDGLSPDVWCQAIAWAREIPRRTEQMKVYNAKFAKRVAADSTVKLDRVRQRLVEN